MKKVKIKKRINVNTYQPGVWCCERGPNCKWPSNVLSNGLAWGTIPTDASEPKTHPCYRWHFVHADFCKGKLIQLIEPKMS